MLPNLPDYEFPVPYICINTIHPLHLSRVEKPYPGDIKFIILVDGFLIYVIINLVFLSIV